MNTVRTDLTLSYTSSYTKASSAPTALNTIAGGGFDAVGLYTRNFTNHAVSKWDSTTTTSITTRAYYLEVYLREDNTKTLNDLQTAITNKLNGTSYSTTGFKNIGIQVVSDTNSISFTPYDIGTIFYVLYAITTDFDYVLRHDTSTNTNKVIVLQTTTYEYFSPSGIFHLYRSTSGGAISESGNYVKATNVQMSLCSFPSQASTGYYYGYQITAAYKCLTTGGTPTTYTTVTSPWSGILQSSGTVTPNLNSGLIYRSGSALQFNTSYEYMIRFTISDVISSSSTFSSVTTISSQTFEVTVYNSTYTLHFAQHGTGIGIGQLASTSYPNTVQINPNWGIKIGTTDWITYGSSAPSNPQNGCIWLKPV